LLLGGVFVVGGLIVREIPVVADLVTRLLRYSDQGSWRLTMAIALLAAVAEEMFYRGALYTALGRHHPLLISTVIYALATLGSSRNPMLAFAAIILGTVCALERRATGGVLAPILTHFVWTLVVLLGLPPLFGL
jgi:membrane protease YdiL (CAAX protease family)